jgi:hypothetical protein
LDGIKIILCNTASNLQTTYGMVAYVCVSIGSQGCSYPP